MGIWYLKQWEYGRVRFGIWFWKEWENGTGKGGNMVMVKVGMS